MTEQDIFIIKYAVFSQILMFAIFAVIHIGQFRLVGVKKILRTTLIQGMISGVISLVIMWLIFKDQGQPILSQSLLNLSLFSVMVFSYGSMGPIMADRSVSVFLLILLNENETGKLSGHEMANYLGGHAMFDKRFEEHADVGAITVDEDTLAITDKGRRIAVFYTFILNVLKLKRNF
jgi:hypothetical protein